MTAIPLPTDNLYKFIALSGIALVVLSLTFPITRLEKIEQAALTTKTQYKILSIEVNSLDYEVVQFQNEMNVLEANIDRKARDTTILRTKLEALKAKNLELTTRRVALETKQEELAGNSELQALLMRQMGRIWTYLQILGIAGVFMASLGFYFWYRRVQQPADIATRQGQEEKKKVRVPFRPVKKS